MTDTIHRIEDECKRTNTALYGRSGHPEEGLIVKVDRLIQSEKRRTWGIRTAVTAALGALATALIEHFKH